MDRFISIDWGTTNLRMYLVALPSLEVIKSTKDLQGIKSLHLKAKNRAARCFSIPKKLFDYAITKSVWFTS